MPWRSTILGLRNKYQIIFCMAFYVLLSTKYFLLIYWQQQNCDIRKLYTKFNMSIYINIKLLGQQLHQCLKYKTILIISKVDQHSYPHQSNKPMVALKNFNQLLQMVKFGKFIKALRRKEWEGFYIDYNKIKRVIELDPRAPHLPEKVLKLIDNEITRASEFYSEQTDKLACEKDFIQIGNLSRFEVTKRVSKLLAKTHNILQFSELNLLGICKALKKMRKQIQMSTPIAFNYLNNMIQLPTSNLNELRSYNVKSTQEIQEVLDYCTEILAQIYNATPSSPLTPASNTPSPKNSLTEPLLDFDNNHEPEDITVVIENKLRKCLAFLNKCNSLLSKK